MGLYSTKLYGSENMKFHRIHYNNQVHNYPLNYQIT